MESLPRKLLINGNLKDSSSQRLIPVINPANETVFDHVPEATLTDLNEAAAGAKAAFELWKNTPFDERAACMKRFGALISSHSQELAESLTKEQGKPLVHSQAEVTRFIEQADLHARNGKIPPVVLHEDADGKTEVHTLPIGVVGGITPWNFPLTTAASKLFASIITGNTFMLKPSPHTPLTTVLLAKLARESFPAGVINILSGSDALGQAMVDHVDINVISFTGSIPTGKKIMAGCSKNLKHTALELGGNDAAIVLPDVDPATVAPKLFTGAMINSGQTCCAIKRLYVHADVYDEIVAGLVAEAKKAKFGDGMLADSEYGPLNNKMQFDKVKSMVERAVADGAHIEAGANPQGGAGFFYPATVLTNVSEGMAIVDEEQFGPVIPVLKYTQLDDAVKRANNTHFGLTGSCWSKDANKATKVAAQLEAGTAFVNTHAGVVGTPYQGVEMPFGGSKWSGIGREFGSEGLREFTEKKSYKISKSY